MSTITKDAFVSKNHKLSLDLDLPADCPTGAVEVSLTVKPRANAQAKPESDGDLARFMNSPLFGLWSDREDMASPSGWVRSIRRPRNFDFDSDLPGTEKPQ